MALRKPHNKSRYGCDQCRKRRVKCDETPPRCSNCITRNEPCQYSRIPPAKKYSNPQTTPSPSHESATDPQERTRPRLFDYSEWTSETIRCRELTLMHQWCCYTYECTSPQWHRILQEWVGREIVRCDFLMAAVFAFSSFHLAANALDDVSQLSTVRKHVSIGLEYQDRALHGLQNALRAITTDNAAHILFTSILVAACAVISSILPTGPEDQARSAALELLPLVDHIKSIGFVKTQTQPFLGKSSLGQYIDKNYQPPNVYHQLCVNELRRLNESTALDYRGVYEDAISSLEKIAQAHDTISEWIADVGMEFLGALRKEENMALAIYMHWGVLIDRLEGNWWAKFVGRRLVAELSDFLVQRGPEWEPISVWCRKQVELPITNSASGN